MIMVLVHLLLLASPWLFLAKEILVLRSFRGRGRGYNRSRFRFQNQPHQNPIFSSQKRGIRNLLIPQNKEMQPVTLPSKQKVDPSTN